MSKTKHGPRYESLGTLGDSRANVTLGTRYLGEMVRRYGATEEALRGHNRGPARARDHRSRDRYAESVALSALLYLAAARMVHGPASSSSTFEP